MAKTIGDKTGAGMSSSGYKQWTAYHNATGDKCFDEFTVASWARAYLDKSKPEDVFVAEAGHLVDEKYLRAAYREMKQWQAAYRGGFDRHW